MNQDVQEAIDRARTHLRNATREVLEAARALIEAIQYAGGAKQSGPGSLSADLKRALDNWIDSVEQDRLFAMPKALAEPLYRALNAEIDRWEKRSESDQTARPVLRTFLAFRELLWEFGMPRDRQEQRGQDATDTPSSKTPRTKKVMSASSRRRVQRFDIED